MRILVLKFPPNHEHIVDDFELIFELFFYSLSQRDYIQVRRDVVPSSLLKKIFPWLCLPLGQLLVHQLLANAKKDYKKVKVTAWSIGYRTLIAHQQT